MDENHTNLPSNGENETDPKEQPKAPNDTDGDNGHTPDERDTNTQRQASQAGNSAPAKDGDIDTVHAMIRELGELIAANQNPPEPTPEEKRAAALADQKARKRKIRKRRHKAFRGMLARLAMLVMVVYVLFFHLVGVTTMPNGDMYPRIDSGDLVLFYRLDKDVRAQDIIVFEKDLAALQSMMDETTENGLEHDVYVPDSVHEAPSIEKETDKSIGGLIREYWNKAVEFLRLRRDESKQMFICRVVATAGDTVEITDDGRLIVNGNAMIESNIFSQTTSYISFTQYPLTLHAGECFVMADLRNGGADSRFFGSVKNEEILGTVITIMRRNNL